MSEKTYLLSIDVLLNRKKGVLFRGAPFILGDPQNTSYLIRFMENILPGGKILAISRIIFFWHIIMTFIKTGFFGRHCNDN